MSAKRQEKHQRQDDLNYSLLEAAVDGDESRVISLLDAGACIDAVLENGKSAIQLAAKFHNHRIVRLLLARGARVAEFPPDNASLLKQEQAFMNGLFAHAGT